jgi:glutamate racemase
MPDAKSPIGIFDSGVGGLSVAIEILRQFPSERIIYYADSARAPWGVREPERIRVLARQCAQYLIDRGVKIIVVACNTASVHALADLRAHFTGMQFVGMVPAVKPAAQATRTRHIGVLATWATAHGQALADLVSEFVAPHQVVADVVVPEGLVEQVEAGEFHSVRTKQILEGALRPLMESGVDTLVLGCTHFPFVSDAIREITGNSMQLVDAAAAVARQCGRVLELQGLRAKPTEHEVPRITILTSGDPARVGATASAMLAFRVEPKHLLIAPEVA